MRLSIQEMERNLRDGWAMVTPDQLYSGMRWYPVAHDFAHDVGHGDVVKGAGLIAALSPNKAWATNCALAIDAGNGYFHGHVGNALGKAQAIYDGAAPESVLPMGKKTGHFFYNILHPTDSSHVTIDRHAIRALRWSWKDGAPTVTDREYADCVVAFQNVSRNVGVAAPMFQAGLWEWARAYYVA